ncbi:aminoglycoside N3'-acetyltransferase [Alkalibacterium iburiense]|uniref:Aminoglycoside N(3)-acetyltransferase n=1 Tax=Alkalibacterium iburiense TaxID=290589 RepID=A0ABN0XBV5_9LACT
MVDTIIKKTSYPHTVKSIAEDLKILGVKEDSILLVHSSLSQMGWVNGGAMAVVEALMTVVDKEKGCLVMPSQTMDWSEPSKWDHPAVPQKWWEAIRETMPAFDKDKTPCLAMGVIADLFRTYPDVKRSSHPGVSFTAWGKHADYITVDHALNFGLGEESPLKKLYELDASVLAIGTDYDTSTAFHLGEYRAPNPPLQTEGTALMENGKRVWKIYTDIEMDEEQFLVIGKQMEKDRQVQIGIVGDAKSRLYSVREAVDRSEVYFTDFRRK